MERRQGADGARGQLSSWEGEENLRVVTRMLTPGMVKVGMVARCPNAYCGYEGPMEERRRGSLIVLLLLLVFGFVVGGLVYYLAACRGRRYVCPRCGLCIGSS